jgi:hypothetical protein
MTSFRLALAATFAAVGVGCDPDCSFDHVIDEAIGDQALRDCGSPSSNHGEPGDLTPWRAAHDCAVASSSTQEPFVVRWLVPGFEGAVRYAVVGRDSGGLWSLAQFIEGYNPDGSTQPTVEYSCAALIDRGDCGSTGLTGLTQTLCIECTDRARVAGCGG